MPKAPGLLSFRQRSTAVSPLSRIRTRSLPNLLHHSRTKHHSSHPPLEPKHHPPQRPAIVHRSQTLTTSTSHPHTMSSAPSPTPLLVRFYDPTNPAPDPKGRTVSSILALPDTELEYRHDYIQLLFPLPEASAFHASAPIIDSATFTAFRTRPELQSQLTKSLTRMLHFYGFEASRSQAGDSNVDIVRGDNFKRASKNWVKRFNHNHLRITRIIRCLRVLGLEEHAAGFFRVLRSVYNDGRSGIGGKSMMFWFVPPRPIMSLFKPIGSPETLSRDPPYSP